jgi:hypothetical protein
MEEIEGKTVMDTKTADEMVATAVFDTSRRLKEANKVAANSLLLKILASLEPTQVTRTSTVQEIYE